MCAFAACGEGEGAIALSRRCSMLAGFGFPWRCGSTSAISPLGGLAASAAQALLHHFAAVALVATDGNAVMRCGTPSRRHYSPAALICAVSKSCSDMRHCRRLRAMPTSTRRDCCAP
jgi:hypothetical protein